MNQSSPSADEAQALISQLQRLQNGNKPQSASSSLPTPRQLFTIGGILFRISNITEKEAPTNDLIFAYQNLVDSLPPLYWKHVLAVHQKAADCLLVPTTRSSNNSNSTIDKEMEDLVVVSRAWNGLFANAPRLCQIAYSKEWVAILAILYDRMVVGMDGVATRMVQNKYAVLSTLSSLLLDGLLLPAMRREKKSSTISLEEQVLEAIHAMEEHSTDCLGDLQTWQTENEPFRRTLETEIRKLPHRADNGSGEEDVQQQREYILNMLESARQPKEEIASTVLAAHHHGNKNASVKASATLVSKPISAADELERRIQQVKQILPNFGEGFIETALSLHKGDVEHTVTILLGDPSTYPYALRVLDQTLPRRRKERAQEEAEQAAEARQVVKERVALEAKQEEAKYKALRYIQEQEAADQETMTVVPVDEYDDDYDDQYDEIDVRLGNADEGMYDYEQIKLYNQVVLSEEKEVSFWQDNRNTNRIPKSNNNKQKGKQGSGDQETNGEESHTSAGKQYRGPDKIKGGRVIGPDGKVVRKPGGARGTQGKVNNGGGSQGPSKESKIDSSNGDGKSTGGQTNSLPRQPSQGKPKTKPKSDNRVSRQRDRKQKAQGTFGADK